MDYYQCNKCGRAIKNSRTPSPVGCPNSAFHHWHKLGSVGTHNYICSKCGTAVEMDRTPSPLGCPSAAFHHWNAMGGQSASDYQTQKRSVGTDGSKSGGGCMSIALLVVIVVVMQIWNHFDPSDNPEPVLKSDVGSHMKVPPEGSRDELPKPIPKAIPVNESDSPEPQQASMLRTFVVFGIPPGDSLNVRNSPSASSVPMFQLTNGQEVQFSGATAFNGETEWMHIQFGEQHGWVNRVFLAPKL